MEVCKDAFGIRRRVNETFYSGGGEEIWQDLFRMTERTVRWKEGSYEMSVCEASVADTKTRKDDFHPAKGAMRGCPRSLEVF